VACEPLPLHSNSVCELSAYAGYYITDREATGRYLDILFAACLAQWACSDSKGAFQSRTSQGFGNKTRSR